MDPVRKQRRNGILTVAAVLVVVCVWWMVFVPHTRRYKTYEREGKLKETIQAIMPPAGTKTVSVKTDHLNLSVGSDHHVEVLTATGIYSTASDCERVKTHYKEEFTRHGFTLRTERKDAGADSKVISFSAPDYDASVLCIELPAPPLVYMITLNSTYVPD